jgi:hypothetical protein
METEVASRVCKNCLELNLIEEVRIARCIKCNLIYCVHFASSIDPAHCIECLSDISVTKEVITKTYEHYNEETDVTTSSKRRARSIKIAGMDWLFAQRKIYTLSDNELELAIEYHRAILDMMLKEREERRSKYAHRFAGVQIPKSALTGVSANEKVEVKRTRVISSTKKEAGASALMKSLLDSGMSIDQIMKMLEGVGK